MSVPTYQRKTGKLEAIVKAKAFYVHIARSLMNEKKFDPMYWDIITKDIIRKAQKLYLDCWRANNIRVSTKNEYLARRRLRKSHPEVVQERLVSWTAYAGKGSSRRVLQL